MYIGKIPATGAFQKCDAISVVNGQAAYTLQVSSTNVSPESVNHMIVSLNGVIQVPTTAYTVAGAVLTFDSNLATGDVIDFVLLLGNVLDVGTPTDNTVATAKIQDDAVTLAKMAAGTDGNVISYDASGNPVAIATGSDGQLLTSTGAGSPPAFEDAPAGGLSEADQWRLNTSLTPSGTSLEVITANWEQMDVTPQGKPGSGMSQSSGIFTFPSTGYWWVQFNVCFQNTNNTVRHCKTYIQVTTNNSSYTSHTTCAGRLNGAGGVQFEQVPADVILDVTDTTNIKCKFAIEVYDESNSMVISGDSSANRTYATFIKLGAT